MQPDDNQQDSDHRSLGDRAKGAVTGLINMADGKPPATQDEEVDRTVGLLSAGGIVGVAGAHTVRGIKDALFPPSMMAQKVALLDNLAKRIERNPLQSLSQDDRQLVAWAMDGDDHSAVYKELKNRNPKAREAILDRISADEQRKLDDKLWRQGERLKRFVRKHAPDGSLRDQDFQRVQSFLEKQGPNAEDVMFQAGEHEEQIIQKAYNKRGLCYPGQDADEAFIGEDVVQKRVGGKVAETAASAQAGRVSAAYTGETIRHTDGVDYAVVDTSRVDFDSNGATFGKKTKPTLVRVAKAGEEIITNPGAVEESRTIAKGGELIFINRLPGGKEDAFIPRANGVPNGQEILDQRYELVSGDVNGEGALFRPKGPPSRLLHEVVDRPTVIRDVWGPGQHQFLDKGATLKSENGRVTGIDKAAFDETWSITDKAGRIQGETAAPRRVGRTTFGEHARSGRPGQDFGPEMTDPETGRRVNVNKNGQRTRVMQTVQERVAENEHIASVPQKASPSAAAQRPDARPIVNATTPEGSVGASPSKSAVASDVEVVLEGGEGAASKGGVLRGVAETAGRVLKPLKPLVKPIKVLAKGLEKAAAPIAVGAVAYQTATEQGTGARDKSHFKEERLTGGTLVALTATMNPVEAIAGGWAVDEKIEINKTQAREDDRFKQSFNFSNAIAAAHNHHIHQRLVEKGAAFDQDDKLELTNGPLAKRNRELLRETLDERIDDLKDERDHPKSWGDRIASWVPLSFGERHRSYHNLTAEVNFLSAASGELQNYDLSHKPEASAGLFNRVCEMEAGRGMTPMSCRHEPPGDKAPTQVSVASPDPVTEKERF